MEEIEKVLAVLNQVREEACWDLETLEVRSLVTNSLQLIDGLHDHKSSLTWALVNLLAKVATLQNAPRIVSFGLLSSFVPIMMIVFRIALFFFLKFRFHIKKHLCECCEFYTKETTLK